MNRVSIILLFICLALYSSWNSLALAGSPPVEIERSAPVTDTPDLKDIKRESVRYITLIECFQLATENSMEMKTGATNLKIAELKLANAEASYWPRVVAGIDYAIDDKGEFEFESDRFEAYLSLSQSLFNSSENIKIKKEATTSLLTAELGLEKQRRGLLLSTIDRYFALLAAQKQLKSWLAMNEKSNRDYKAANSKYHDGLASAVEVLQAETSHSANELNLQIKKNSLEYAAMTLATAMGLPANTKLRAIDVDRPDFFKIDWERCLEIATSNNTELKIYQKTLEHLKRFQKLANRTRWPTLSLSAFIGADQDDLYHEDANVGLKLTLSQTLFDAGIISRNIKQYALETKKQETLIRSFKKKMSGELKLHYDNVNNRAEEFLKSRKRRDLARKLAGLMHRSYDLGTISFKEKLDSDDIAGKAEIAYTAALAKYLMAEYQLKLKMGLNPVEKTENPNDSSSQGIKSDLPPGANHNNQGKSD
ncbi:MAG: TolC family protein [Desulfobacterales bacterium]